MKVIARYWIALPIVDSLLTCINTPRFGSCSGFWKLFYGFFYGKRVGRHHYNLRNCEISFSSTTHQHRATSIMRVTCDVTNKTCPLFVLSSCTFGPTTFSEGTSFLSFVYITNRHVHLLEHTGLPINSLNAELNPSRHLLALVGARHIVHGSRVRVKWPLCLGLRTWVCFDDCASSGLFHNEQ
jgi:hypothetical protein